jgi:uncharacterized phage protein (TIGR01671 family)
MRDIKFRVWDKEVSKYVSDLHHISISPFGGIYNLQDGDGGPERYDLQQYTGLHDRNGKEIYDLDLLRNAEGKTYAVMWSPEGCFFCVRNKNGEPVVGLFDPFPLLQSNIQKEEMEVIGNIWENPTLLDDWEPKEGPE